MKKHIEAEHEKIRNHVCGECGYAASLKSELKKHIEAIHKNIKKWILRQPTTSLHGNIRNHVYR